MSAESDVLQAQCLKNVVVEEHGVDGNVARSELSTDLKLKKEFGNARLVSDDTMIWVANATMQRKPDEKHAQEHVTITTGKRSFSFFLECNQDSEAFLTELRKQVDGQSGLEARRKKRKIRKQLADNQVAGFVPVVNNLKSPLQQQSPTTPVRRRLSDSTNSPRLAPPHPLSVSTVSEARTIQPSPAKSPFRSPFAKKLTPPPRLASPIVSLPPMSPAPRSVATPSSGSSQASHSASPRPREWLSPARGGALRVRPQLTPPSLRSDNSQTPGTNTSSNSSDKENTPHNKGGGIVNKRVRSLQRMLDDVPREEPEHSAGVRPSTVRSPYFFSPTNAREMSPSQRPSPAKKLRSPGQPLGELHQNVTPPRPPVAPLPSLADSAAPPRKVTHGLLNLGNYCYMNAIIQSLAAIPGFVEELVTDDRLLTVIGKHAETQAADGSRPSLAKLLQNWKSAEPAQRLVVQNKLAQLLQQVVDGSDASINPEPLKAVMGRKNTRFASHMQQDAHEFLLHLVTEYERELVQAVRGVIHLSTTDASATDSESEPASEPAVTAAPKRASLLNFFRVESKTKADTPQEPAPATAPPSPPPAVESELEDNEELISELFPAECFRTELYRTLTCRSCQYSRRQVEKFYDFSLDLPFVAPPPPSPVREPEGPAPTASHKCHCGVDALVVSEGDKRIYVCAKSACSLRQVIEAAEQPPQEPQAPPAPVPAPAARLPTNSLSLPELLKDQFKADVLELTCEKCKDGREAAVTYEVKSLPKVLVLHLKRFEVNPHSGSLYKRCDMVEAPAVLCPEAAIRGESPPGSGEEKQKTYAVKSVVHHLGRTIDEGHYMADVCGPRGDWRRRNDTQETLIGEDFALRASRSQESCYMFFYVLVQDTPATAPDGDEKENVTVPSSSPVVVSTPASPATLVGRRRQATPPRDTSTVSKSLHELL